MIADTDKEYSGSTRMSRTKLLRMTMRTTLEALAAVTTVLVVLETLTFRNLVALIPLCLPVWAQAAKVGRPKALKALRERRFVVLVLDYREAN